MTLTKKARAAAELALLERMATMEPKEPRMTREVATYHMDLAATSGLAPSL